MNKIRGARLFKRLIAYLLCFVTFAAPYHAIAAEVTLRQAGQQGQSFAEMLLNNMQQPTESGGTINFPDANTQIKVSDLFPGSSGTSGKVAGYFSPDGDNDVGVAQENHESGHELDNKGAEKQGLLYSDAVGGEQIQLGYTSPLDSSPTIQGAAYKIILDRKSATKPDMRNDPAINSSRDIIQDLGEDFSDCTLDEIVTKQQGSIHLADLQQCERINKPAAGTCSITNDVDLRTSTFDIFVAAKGEVWLTVEFDLKSGTWKTVAPTDGHQFSGKVPSVDYSSICNNDYKASVKASVTDYIGARDWLGHGLSGSFDSTIYYRSLQSPSCDNGLVGVVQIQDTSGGSDGGKYIMGGQFTYQVTGLRGNSWGPDECIQSAKMTGDGFCDVSWKVVTGATNSSQCLNVSGYSICPGSAIANAMGKPPVPGVPNLAGKVDVNVKGCGFNKGEIGCYETASGELECPYNEGDTTSTCTEFEDDPQCGFIKGECIEGAVGKSGICYAYEETWDCGKKVDYDFDKTEEQYICDGPISCMGEECITVNRETSDGFGKAAALLNVLEHADGLLECGDDSNEGLEQPGGGVTDDSGLDSCTIFKGEGQDCKKAMGGMVDCCEKPKGVSLGDYLTMLQATKKIDSAMFSISQTTGFGSATASQYVTKFREPVQGAYNAIKKPIVDGFKEITSPFVNYAESAGANYTISQKITQQVLQTVYDNLGSQAKSFLVGVLDGMGYDALVQAGGAVGGEAAGGDMLAQAMGKTVGSIISFIGWVYLAYQVATLIIQMIYKCTKPEMELMVNVQLKKCSYVGSYCDSKVLGQCVVKKQSYCCYDSPLARIVVEQGYKQLGKTQGEPKAPQCDGLTLAEMNRLDWDRIDLSEWTGMLIEHNLYAGTASLNSDSITGKGSYLPGENGERMNVEDRTDERFKDTYVDDIRVDFSQKLEFSGGKKN